MKDRTVLFCLLMLVLNVGCYSSKENDIKELTGKLTWESIEVTHSTHAIQVDLIDSVSQTLVNIGKPSSGELISVLNDTKKGVIAHLILTQIWTKKEMNTEVSYEYDRGDIVKFNYTVNNLAWSWEEKNGYTVKQSDLDKIKIYWKERVPKKYVF